MKQIPPNQVQHLQNTAEPGIKTHDLYLHNHMIPTWDTRVFIKQGETDLLFTKRLYSDTLPLRPKYNIASAPEFIAMAAHEDAAQSRAGMWSREYTGVDTTGKIVNPGEEVQLYVHGPDILSQFEYAKLHSREVEHSFEKLYEQRFQELLNGKRGNYSIDLYSIDDVVNNKVPNPFGNYVVYVTKPKHQKEGQLNKTEFMKSRIMLARAGTPEYLEVFFEKYGQESKSTPQEKSMSVWATEDPREDLSWNKIRITTAMLSEGLVYAAGITQDLTLHMYEDDGGNR